MKSRSQPIFSSKAQLNELAKLVQNYVRLPFSPIAVPGGVLEGALSHVRGAKVLGKYDFVDVVDERRKIGWQVKSTLEKTPITWKRVKLKNRESLIDKSIGSEAAIQVLGDTIIAFCNEHARRSFEKHELEEIGYARLIIHKDRLATYFERVLCTKDDPRVFHAEDFKWTWSKQKETKGKDQLSALHGIHIKTKTRWFAWHGRGENQLHFTGEGSWWPAKGQNTNAIRFTLPTEAQRLSVEQFADLLANTENPLPEV